MRENFLRRGALAVSGAGALAAAMLGTPTGAHAAPTPTYTINQVGNYGGEPSITSAGAAPSIGTPGELYEASLLAPAAFRSSNQGGGWTRGTTNAFSSTGDDCVVTDQAGQLYLCNLTILGPGTAALQGDVYRSKDQGNTWIHSAGHIPLGQNTGVCPAPFTSTSCNPFGVDRDWVDAWIPPNAPSPATDNAEVVLMYHDFYGPSHIWVNVSNNSAQSFGAAQDVLASLDTSAGAGNALALLDTACSTVPAGVKIVQSGPHAGRIYVAWIAADPSSTLTGCNISQAQAFHNIFVAYQDPGQTKWTPQLAFDGGPFHDSSTPFVAFTLDDQGNPYFAFGMNHWNSNAVTNAGYAAQCQTFSGLPSNGLQAHPECGYDMYVLAAKVASDGSLTWDGGGGLVPGSAAAPYLVNDPATEPGTHVFPAIAAGDPGQVYVSYLRTPTIEPTNATGKFDPGGCAGPGQANPAPTPPNPLTYPATCNWDLYAAQTTSLPATPPATPAFVTENLTSPGSPGTTPMHAGDICNLGIACQTPPAGNSNRHLADFIMETIDVTTGCTHIAYADDATTHVVETANQTPATCVALTQQLGAGVPEAPWAVVFVPAAIAATVATGYVVRRRRNLRQVIS